MKSEIQNYTKIVNWDKWGLINKLFYFEIIDKKILKFFINNRIFTIDSYITIDNCIIENKFDIIKKLI